MRINYTNNKEIRPYFEKRGREWKGGNVKSPYTHVQRE